MADSQTAGGGGGGESPSSGTGSSPLRAVAARVAQDKVEASMWLTRLGTVVFTVFYMIPLVGQPYANYQRALACSVATSCFRLHQRMPRAELSRLFIAQLLLEDSCHYLIFSLAFLYLVGPVTLALMPVFCFALLHATKYTYSILNAMGSNSLPAVRALLSKVDSHQVTLLSFIACTEIFLMPALVLLIFSGQAALFLPIIYYQFLTLRYASRRNPYCRQLFHEMRVKAEELSRNPRCPGLVSSLVTKSVSLISRCAPPLPASS